MLFPYRERETADEQVFDPIFEHFAVIEAVFAEKLEDFIEKEAFLLYYMEKRAAHHREIASLQRNMPSHGLNSR